MKKIYLLTYPRIKSFIRKNVDKIINHILLLLNILCIYKLFYFFEHKLTKYKLEEKINTIKIDRNYNVFFLVNIYKLNSFLKKYYSSAPSIQNWIDYHFFKKTKIEEKKNLLWIYVKKI